MHTVAENQAFCHKIHLIKLLVACRQALLGLPVLFVLGEIQQ